MTETAAPQRYSTLSIVLHWMIAVVVLYQLFLNGPATHGMAEDVPAATKAVAIVPHASVGFSIMILMLFRLWLRRREGKPAYPEGVSKRQIKIATGLHHGFYALLILQPLLGALLGAAEDFPVAPFGLVPTSAFLPSLTGAEDLLHTLHGSIPLLLLVMVLAHVAVAIVHLFKRDGVFSRMLPGG